MSIFIYLFCSWGFTHILVAGSIFETPRNWLIVRSKFLQGVLTCHQCCGFWVGMILYFFTTSLPDFFWLYSDFIFWGFISSGMNALTNAIILFLLSNRKKDK
jgi:hypothetical protein